MLRRVALVRTDVSEELSASFIRVTRIGEQGTTLAVTSNRRTLRRNTNIPEDTILHSHRHENLKSYRSSSNFNANFDLILLLNRISQNFNGKVEFHKFTRNCPVYKIC
jgi:hypothetical protein